MSRKTPAHYRIEDFITDESFINYHFRVNTDDQTYWENWIIAHPANRELVEEARKMLGDLSLTLSDDEFKKELARINKAIRYEKPQFIRNKPAIARLLNWENAAQVKDKRKKYLMWLAPAILIFLVGSYFFLKHVAVQPEHMSEKYNESAKSIDFTLSDGTIVTLAPHGVFRYPQSFGNKDREVYLDGEAQFHVARDEAHPFKVYSGDVITTVLGTVFNIKKQHDGSVVLVELIKGKLKVNVANNPGSPTQSIILNPDERAVYERLNQKLYKEKWQSQNILPLQSRNLVFRQNNFEEVARQLKAVFGIIVINQSNKKNWRFTGEFKDTSVIDIVESICIVEKLKYEVLGDTILIK